MEYFNAFLCGGLLCALGQILIDRTKLTPAKILVCYVTAGVILGGSGLYQYLVDWAGSWCHRSPHRLWLYPGKRSAGGGTAARPAGGFYRGSRGHGRRCGRRHLLRLSGRPAVQSPAQTLKKSVEFFKTPPIFLTYAFTSFSPATAICSAVRSQSAPSWTIRSFQHRMYSCRNSPAKLS